MILYLGCLENKMTNTTARIKKAGKHFEILVNMEDALKFRKGETKFFQAEGNFIFTDMKKGEKASSSLLKESFGTDNFQEICEKIVKQGEIQTTEDYRDEEREKKLKQVVDILVRNAVDPKTGLPHTPDRIKSALEQAHVNIKNTSIESQLSEIVEAISKLIPIKISQKRIRITIPSMHTGKAYGIIAPYKESENWLGNGDLEVTVKVPAGIIMDFYDKLNSVTHGSALTEEIKDD